jgi:hypothetical protein
MQNPNRAISFAVSIEPTPHNTYIVYPPTPFPTPNPSNTNPALQIRHAGLKRKPQRQPRMLQHVIEAQILNLILCGMDLGVAVAEVRLDDKGGGVAVFAGGGVVGAGVAASGEDVGDGAVLGGRGEVC